MLGDLRCRLPEHVAPSTLGAPIEATIVPRCELTCALYELGCVRSLRLLRPMVIPCTERNDPKMLVDRRLPPELPCGTAGTLSLHGHLYTGA